MTHNNKTNAAGAEDANARLAEIRQIFERYKTAIEVLCRELGTAEAGLSTRILAKITDLQTAHLEVVAAEEAFNEKFKTEIAGTEIDFDTARRDIGRQLDRIRKTIRTAEVPE